MVILNDRSITPRPDYVEVFICKALVRKQRFDYGLDIHFGAAVAAVQPEPLETKVVVNGGFPSLRKAVFWIRPAFPKVEGIMHAIAVEKT